MGRCSGAVIFLVVAISVISKISLPCCFMVLVSRATAGAATNGGSNGNGHTGGIIITATDVAQQQQQKLLGKLERSVMDEAGI